MSVPKQTLVEALKVVLRDEAHALHVNEIARLILARKLWSTTGKTPADTISARLATDIKAKGAASEFVRVAPNTYGLNTRLPDLGTSADVGATPPSLTVPTTVPAAGPSVRTLSFTDAAEQVLVSSGNKQPLHYGEITRLARQNGLIATQGQTPEATMYAQILTEIDRRSKRGETPRFVKHGKGLVSLTKWLPVGLAGQINAHNDAVRKQLHDKLYSLTPTEFETLIGQLLGALGFENIQVTRTSGDGGIDVYGTLVIGDVIRTQVAVQVKRWKQNIQAPLVQQVRGSLGVHDQGLIITTSDFSKGARAEAAQLNKTPVALMDGGQLVGLLVEHGIMVQHTDYHLLQLT